MEPFDAVMAIAFFVTCVAFVYVTNSRRHPLSRLSVALLLAIVSIASFLIAEDIWW